MAEMVSVEFTVNGAEYLEEDVVGVDPSRV
jgi:hypothetical protein